MSTDDRKAMMTVVVDLNSVESIRFESERWAKLESNFMDLIHKNVESLSVLLHNADKSGGLQTDKLHKLIWEIAMAYQDYGVAFATSQTLKTFGEYQAQFEMKPEA